MRISSQMQSRFGHVSEGSSGFSIFVLLVEDNDACQSLFENGIEILNKYYQNDLKVDHFAF